MLSKTKRLREEKWSGQTRRMIRRVGGGMGRGQEKAPSCFDSYCTQISSLSLYMEILSRILVVRWYSGQHVGSQATQQWLNNPSCVTARIKNCVFPESPDMGWISRLLGLYWFMYIKLIMSLQILNKQALSLLKTLVGNDKVKEEAMKSGVSQLIVAAMTKHEVRRHTSVHPHTLVHQHPCCMHTVWLSLWQWFPVRGPWKNFKGFRDSNYIFINWTECLMFSYEEGNMLSA